MYNVLGVNLPNNIKKEKKYGHGDYSETYSVSGFKYD